MPKASKSSASSGTRKKHARKAAGSPTEVPSPPQKSKSKPSKKEIKKGLAPPPKKSYIAPSKLKPTPAEADPLDSLGLAAVLPAELVVVLRRLAKKDTITKTRALEELGVWISKAKEEDKYVEVDLGRSGVSIDVLVTALPVWLHRYPSLSVHSSRRIRHLSALLHASLLEVPALRSVILMFLLETGSESQVSQVLGAWCLSVWDVDRAVATPAGRGWEEAVAARPGQGDSIGESETKFLILDDSMLERYVLPFILTAIMDPNSTYGTLNPSHPANLGNSSSSHVELSRQGAFPSATTPPGSASRNILNANLSGVLPSRGEDDPESAEDRNARLRVGAMGVLKWIFETYPPAVLLLDTLRWLLMSSQFWSVLHHVAQPPFLQTHHQSPEMVSAVEASFTLSGVIQGFGSGQTIVRRAGWGIVHALVGDSGTGAARLRWKDYLPGENSLGLLSSAILRSAFVETDPVVRSSMWGPLLIALTKIDNAWKLNLEFEHAYRKDGNADDSESELSGAEDGMDPSILNDDPAVDIGLSAPSSVAYAEFLAFLALGCNGSPIQGYPTILVILSTIPKEILPLTFPTLSEFFDALWAAIDGQALSTLASERAKSTDAFLGTWGECLLWISGKLIKGADAPSDPDNAIQGNAPESGGLWDSVNPESPASISRALVEAQFGRFVGELGKGLRVDASITGVRAAAVLGKLELGAPDLFEQAWMQVSRFARTTIASTEDGARGEYALEFLAGLRQHLPPEGLSRQEVERLVIAIATEVVTKCLAHCLPHEDANERVWTINCQVLERLLDRFEQVLDGNGGFIKQIDELFHGNLTNLLSQPFLILSYLTHRSDSARTVATWRLLLSTLGSSDGADPDTRLRILGVFLDCSQLDGLTTWAKPQGGELDDLVGHALNRALDGDVGMLNLTERLLKRSDAFLGDAVMENVVSTIITTVQTHARLLIRDPSVPLVTLRSSLKLVLALEREQATMLRSSVPLLDVMPMNFLLAFVLPKCSRVEEELLVLDLSRQVWETWRHDAGIQARKIVRRKVEEALKGLIMATDIRPMPTSLLQALPHINGPVEALAFSEILPTQSELDTLLSSTSADPIDRTLTIIEPLAPFSSGIRDSAKRSWNHKFDDSGFSPYARGVNGLLYVMKSDRQFARQNMWALHHVLVLALFASEVLQVPGADSPVFRSNPKMAETELRDISQQAQQLAAFLLVSSDEEAWHQEVTDVLAGKSSKAERLDSMGTFVQIIFQASLMHGTVRDSLVLHTVLQYVLRSATKDDADLWIELARSLEDKALQTSLAISLAVTEFAPEPPKLDRYRNELASKAAGILPVKANTTGLRLLRRLCAVAPNPDSDVVFLPQQRAVFLVQTLQTWIASDEDLSECVESEITIVLFHLAPILQNVQGAHWEFVMDMIESNIENSSFKDPDSLVLLSRSLRLLSCIQDLSVSNKYLRELWGPRSKVVLAMVRDLLAVRIDRIPPSVPRAVCREQALSIIQNLPGSLMDETTLATMCHLVTDSSVDVQKMAHQLLQQAAFKRTQHLVVEAGVDSDSAAIEIPPGFVALLQCNVEFEVGAVGGKAGGQDPLAYLLGWMILFDLFTDASLKVKTAYVDQLRNLNIIGEYFLPNVFEILGVGGEGQRPFGLDVWTVDEYWPTLYDAHTPQSLQLLAAHLYYRALLTVPSLIRTWWDELKDRQLLTAVTSFTSSHFSPVLIASELTHVKPSSSTPTAGEESLNDESFNVKVAFAIHEVTATFNVDDQQMEIGVRLPTEYPLRAVEVRDIRRVGVPEKLWRKWLFAVQQVVTSQNGRIVDALGLFKKNVSLHFEGQVECAICYSIISVIDRSLPSKPCKTCKNRFHSSCLYKWFNTSHSSSCPLCRSDIM